MLIDLIAKNLNQNKFKFNNKNQNLNLNNQSNNSNKSKKKKLILIDQNNLYQHSFYSNLNKKKISKDFIQM